MTGWGGGGADGNGPVKGVKEFEGSKEARFAMDLFLFACLAGL